MREREKGRRREEESSDSLSCRVEVLMFTSVTGRFISLLSLIHTHANEAYVGYQTYFKFFFSLHPPKQRVTVVVTRKKKTPTSVTEAGN